MLDYEGRIANNGAEELFFGYLFEIGKAEFGEEFLCALKSLSSYSRRKRVYLVVAQVSFEGLR